LKCLLFPNLFSVFMRSMTRVVDVDFDRLELLISDFL
jgi:hypothetical protein